MEKRYHTGVLSFSEALFVDEKEGGDKYLGMHRHIDALDFCGLEKLGFEGGKFT